MAVSRLVAPNGGWGWVVVFGVALMNMCNLALVSIFTLMYGGEIENMGHGTSGAALVMNVMSAVTNFSGLITGPAIRHYSYRKVAVTGSILTSLGLILSSQATQLWHLLATYSILTGLGLGLVTPSGFVAVNTYFTTKKGQAVGIAMAGTGLGQMLLPHLVGFLLDEFSYKATTLIFGGIVLNGVVGALLLQPIEWHLKQNETLLEYQVKPQPLGIILRPKKQLSIWSKISKQLDLKLLRDGVFVSISLGLAFVYTVSIFFSMIFPLFLQEGPAQLNRRQTATCMSVLAFADMVSRLTMPTIGQYFKFRARTQFFFATLGLAIARSSVAMQTEYESLLLVSGIIGYIRAVTVVNINLTVAEYVTQTQLPNALGLNMVINGLALISNGQLLGFIQEYTGSFEVAIHCSSVVLVLVFIMWLPEYIFKCCCDKRASNDEVEET